VRDILDALSRGDAHTPISRLEVLVSRPEILSNRRLLDNMNRLCGTDFTPLARALKGKNSNARFFDAGTFLEADDIAYSQKYFTRWLSQVLGTEKT